MISIKRKAKQQLMKKVMLLLLLVSASLVVGAQEYIKSDTLNVDLDKDLKSDLVIFDKENSKIVVQLSTQNFKPIRSK